MFARNRLHGTLKVHCLSCSQFATIIATKIRALNQAKKKTVNMTTKHLRQSFYLLKITHHKERKERDGPKLDGSSRTEYELNMD
jgi:hypothetical protein